VERCALLARNKVVAPVPCSSQISRSGFGIQGTLVDNNRQTGILKPVAYTGFYLGGGGGAGGVRNP